MHRIIYDCDNTMGLCGKDVDDGLTLLYLLGCEDVILEGVTLTHGNSSTKEVYDNTVRMFNTLGIKNVPVCKGNDTVCDKVSDAAIYLANMARKNKGEITLLATGSMTNLYEAYLYDNEFYKNLKNIVIMGGVIEPLIISGVKIDELNLSCDYNASFSLLTSNADITILTGNTCLQALFGEEEIERLINIKGNKVIDFINENIKGWYELIYKSFGFKGFCNWDCAAALYITNPELYETKTFDIYPQLEELKNGFINIKSDEDKGYSVKIPLKIKDLKMFNDILIKSWCNIKNI
ncbi:Inosine-uridine nucleoside N-ribohydrolase [Caloramator quimbayensis]|uniref:Inosine-uridine nucleoside N-ribohydrolase n=1 Tax=Caloramator quimbayensis TaxID=1147123 RepID=A0A1T4X1X7_9CLOT|nr:nucleoside hydrolase [Caloramator quimbayensis]SKA83075.1 Inosine-uridine nucleoside N-ribohydrolase [Caloramator quimbayensis]